MRQKLLLSLLTVLICSMAYSQNLFPANNNNKGKAGYINQYGKTIIPFTYDYTSEFSEGLAFVTKDGNGMFINTKGEVKITGDYLRADGFKNGLAKVRTKDRKVIFINKKGEHVITENIGYNPSFKDGLMVAKIDNKYGYYDTLGNLAIPATYQYASAFSEGVAKVTFTDRSQGFIDTKGKLLFKKPGYRSLSDFSEGLIQLAKRQSYGFADKTGKFVIPPTKLSDQKPYYGKFKNGLARFKTLDDKCGFINKKGEVVIKPIFTDVGEFENGFCKVAKTPKPKSIRRDWAYMNVKGEVITDYKYMRPYAFSEGLAIGQWWDETTRTNYYDLIGETGKIIKTMEAAGMTVKGFKNGLCLVYARIRPGNKVQAPLDKQTLSYLHQYGGARNTYIDKQGKIIWQSAPFYVCFPPYAKVMLSNGTEKTLSELTGNETLLSWDETAEKFVETKLLDIEVHEGNFELVKIGFIPKNRELTASLNLTLHDQVEFLEATPFHPVYTQKGETIMKELKIGDEIYYSKDTNNQVVPCEIISFENVKAYIPKVINLKTDRSNYIINGVIVMRK